MITLTLNPLRVIMGRGAGPEEASLGLAGGLRGRRAEAEALKIMMITGRG